ncbi:MAG: DUF2905 domain-containing protein [Acidobacteriota bacterium]|nr:DUF2905 domain-containing protein [Acidobacteriota bacterium]
MMRVNGSMVVILGLCAVVIGLLMMTGALSWFGRLPGDLQFGGERTRVYIPLASMLLVSLILSLILYVLRRFIE